MAFYKLAPNRKKIKQHLPGDGDQFYRSVLENAPIAIGVHCGGQMVYLNPAGLQLFGAGDLSEMRGKSLLSFVHPDDQPAVVAKMQQLRLGKPSLTPVTFKMISPMGQVTDVEVVGRPTIYRGQPATLVTISDITDRRRMAAALEDSLGREKARSNELKTIMDTVPAFVWFSSDPECKQMISNQFGYNFLNMHAGSNISMSAPEVEMPLHHLACKDGRQILPENMPMQIAAATGKPQLDYEFDVVFDDGRTNHLFGNANPILNENGKPTGSVGVFLDITVRKQGESRIRRQNAVLTGINRIFKIALTSQHERELGEACLKVLTELTDSNFGFIAEINEQTGRLDDIAISATGWAACQMADQSGHGRPAPASFQIKGLYGRVVTDGKGFYTNQPTSHPDSSGTPLGHPAIGAFLGVPLIQAGKTIGMFGLGNRNGGYGPGEMEASETLAPAIVQAILSQRAEKDLYEANEMLQSQAEELEMQTDELQNQTEELTSTNQRLLESEERFRTVADFTYGWEYWRAEDGSLEYVSPSAARVTGRTPQEFIADPTLLVTIVHPDDRAWVERHMQMDLASPKEDALEYRILLPEGEVRWIGHVCQPVYTQNGEFLGRRVSNRDITERKNRDKELDRLNRTLIAQSKSSQAMMRASDEISYLQAVCRIITQDCGHAMTWIGYADNDAAKSVRPVAYEGFENGYLETLKLSWADNERGQGPTGSAIRTGAICQCRNMLTDPAFAPWREEALKRGYGSSIAIPMVFEGKSIGALTIYAREVESFTDHEIDLLSEIANDVVYGITTLRLREYRAKAEVELERQRNWLQVTLTSIGDGVIVTDAAGLVTFINPVAAALTGWSLAEALGQPAQQICAIRDARTGQPADDFVTRPLNEKVIMTITEDSVLVDRSGRAIPIEDSVAPLLDGQENSLGVVLVFHDITERRQAEQKLEAAQVEVVNERNRLLAVMKALPVGIALLDAQGGQVEANPMFRQIWGDPRPVVTSVRDYHAYKATWADTGRPVQPEEWASARAVQKGETVTGQRIQIERLDGSHRYILNSGAPVFDDQGEIIGCAVAVMDTTEQVILEAELCRAQERITGIIDDITERAQSIQTLEKRVDERSRELSTLLAISNGMGSSLELNQFMETILGQLALSVPCTFSLVLLVVKDHFEVMALYETNHKILPPKIQIPLARSKTLNQLINSSKPLLIEDQNAALKDVRINLLEQYFPETIDLRVGSWLGVPMLVKDQIMGILCMAHSQPGAFSYAQTQLVQSVANQAAVAIENVALYAQTRELAVVNERQHLARELHDSVCQSLYGISLGCHVAIAYLNRSPDKVKETLDYILNLADAGLTEMRAMIFNLRPEMLATEGLVEAIHKQAVAIQIRRGIQAITRLGTEPQVSNDIKEALYRIAIEAMNNAIRHANPMQITIDLITQPGEIKLVIGDDGKGFDPSQTFPGHLGLSSMRERAENVRGTLSIESIPGQGTTIQVCVSTPQDVSNQE